VYGQANAIKTVASESDVQLHVHVTDHANKDTRWRVQERVKVIIQSDHWPSESNQISGIGLVAAFLWWVRIEHVSKRHVTSPILMFVRPWKQEWRVSLLPLITYMKRSDLHSGIVPSLYRYNRASILAGSVGRVTKICSFYACSTSCVKYRRSVFWSPCLSVDKNDITNNSMPPAKSTK
jgi:hypothetical protein